MSATLSIDNVLGITSATLDLSAKITLIAGPNGAGKSSIARALACALQGDPLVSKSSAHAFVHAAADAGTIRLEIDGRAVTITYPDRRVDAEYLPTTHPMALGVTLPDMSPAERAKAIGIICDTMPTAKDLADELAVKCIPATLVDLLWKQIEQHGWDEVHAQAKDKGARMKGQWEQIAGTHYGRSVAQTWTPQSWEPELLSESEEALLAKCAAASDARDAVHKQRAIDSAMYEPMRDEAAQVETLQQRVEELESLIAMQEDMLREHETQLAACSAKINSCPACGQVLRVFSDGRLEPHDADKADSETDVKALKETVDTIRGDLQLKRNALMSVRLQLDHALKAREKLATVGDPPGVEEVARADEELQRAAERLNAYRRYREAHNIAQRIEQNADIVETLAPTGLRARVLKRALDAVNARLAELCAIARWPVITMTRELLPALDGRDWFILSESERWRCNAAIAAMVAERTAPDSYMIVDGADILDRDGRNGLIRLAHAVPPHVVICMTASSRDEIPALEAAGLGRAYWIEGGAVA